MVTKWVRCLSTSKFSSSQERLFVSGLRDWQRKQAKGLEPAHQEGQRQLESSSQIARPEDEGVKETESRRAGKCSWVAE